MRRHLTVKSAPMANVRHTLVLLDSLRLVVQHEGARRAVAYARWHCGSSCHTLCAHVGRHAASWQLLAHSQQPRRRGVDTPYDQSPSATSPTNGAGSSAPRATQSSACYEGSSQRPSG
jgi:hypothetical protein